MGDIVGEAWELFGIMDDEGHLTRVVAKNPNRPAVYDVTDNLRSLLKAVPAPPADDEPSFPEKVLQAAREAGLEIPMRETRAGKIIALHPPDTAERS